MNCCPAIVLTLFVTALVVALALADRRRGQPAESLEATYNVGVWMTLPLLLLVVALGFAAICAWVSNLLSFLDPFGSICLSQALSSCFPPWWFTT